MTSVPPTMEALLLDAIRRENLGRLKWLLTEFKFNPTSPQLQDLLTRAIEGHFRAGVTALIDHGAHVDTPDSKGITPLRVAVAVGDAWLCRVLVQRGASVAALVGQGSQELATAAGAGHMGVCRYLLENGADPNAINKDGLSPLHTAAFHNHLAVCKALVAAGADPDLIPNEAQESYLTPFQLVVSHSDRNVATYFIDTFPLLLQKMALDGLTVEQLANNRNLPLVRAAITANAVSVSLNPNLGDQSTVLRPKNLSPL